IDGGPLEILPRVPWGAIEIAISGKSRNEEERAANVSVAKILYDFADAAKLTGHRQEIPRLGIGGVHLANYWEQGLVSFNGQNILPFIDPRKGAARLSGDSRLFVFSVMQQRQLTAGVDLASAQSCIIQIDRGKDGQKVVEVHAPKVEKLIGFKEITAQVKRENACFSKFLKVPNFFTSKDFF